MVSELARGDWEDMKAQGLDPTLEDFDRLNLLALRLTDGAETTAANFPRIGWAGDVPFFEPTIQAFAWYHTYAVRAAANTETEDTLWAFALAHAREPHFFDALVTPKAIDKAASKWAASLPVTKEEVVRACRYAVKGFDDAEPGRAVTPATPAHRLDSEKAAQSLANLEERLAKACAAMHCSPADIQTETPTRLDMICEAAAVELGKPTGKDEARLRAEYGLTLREITLRLRGEKSTAEKVRDAAKNGERGDSGGTVDDKVAPPPPGRFVAGDDGAEGEAGCEVVVEHDDIVPQDGAEVNQ